MSSFYYGIGRKKRKATRKTGVPVKLAPDLAQSVTDRAATTGLGSTCTAPASTHAIGKPVGTDRVEMCHTAILTVADLPRVNLQHPIIMFGEHVGQTAETVDGEV